LQTSTNTATAMSTFNHLLAIHACYRMLLLHAISGVVIATNNVAQDTILWPHRACEGEALISI
jgi:hypothetical protein